MKHAIMACGWIALITASLAGEASAAVWRWSCIGPLGDEEVIFNRGTLVDVPAKTPQGNSIHNRFDVTGDPARQNVFPDLAGGEPENERCGVVRRGIQIEPIKPEEHDHRSQCGSLIAIDERMVLGDAEAIGAASTARSVSP